MVKCEQLAEILVAAARHSLNEGLEKIQHCVAQLSDEQLWWRPKPEMNSIANLMLHLSGNIRQWVVAGIGVCQKGANSTTTNCAASLRSYPTTNEK